MEGIVALGLHDRDKLKRSEFIALCIYNGVKMTEKQEIEWMIEEEVSLDLAIEYIKKLRKDVCKEDIIREMFQIFDKNNTGYINQEAFVSTIKETVPHLPLSTVESLFSDFETHGKIGLRQFSILMQNIED